MSNASENTARNARRNLGGVLRYMVPNTIYIYIYIWTPSRAILVPCFLSSCLVPWLCDRRNSILAGRMCSLSLLPHTGCTTWYGRAMQVGSRPQMVFAKKKKHERVPTHAYPVCHMVQPESKRKHSSRHALHNCNFHTKSTAAECTTDAASRLDLPRKI